jgi:hypothetical protein
MGALTSLTGGGGLSNSSSAASKTGDQGGGKFNVGNLVTASGLSDQQMMIGGAMLLVGVLYAFTKAK